MSVDTQAVARAWAFGDALTDVATVYATDQTTGRRTLLLRDNLPCRVSTSNYRDSGDPRERAELASTRTLYWIDPFTMPPDVLVEVNHDGRRWTVRPETIRVIQQPDGGLRHAECELVGPPRGPGQTPR